MSHALARRLVTGALVVAALVLTVVAVTWPHTARDAGTLLVADLRGHALVLLDPTDPASARRIDLPGGPHELLPLPDGRVAVTLEQSGAIALVDLASGEVATVEVGGVPHGLALDGDTLLVTDRADDTIRRFALDGWRELEALPSGAWPHAVGTLPGGDVVVAAAQDGTLTVGGTAQDSGAVTEALAVSPDGRRVAAAAALDGVVSVYDAAGALLAQYEVGGRPVRVAFSPDGRDLAVALSAAGAVAVIRDGVVRTVAAQGVPDGLAFSPDGRILYASDVAGGSVTAVDLVRSSVSAVIAAGESAGALLVLAR
ncbi:MAG: YncE family protein [Dehalococcoidia bacterium]